MGKANSKRRAATETEYVSKFVKSTPKKATPAAVSSVTSKKVPVILSQQIKGGAGKSTLVKQYMAAIAQNNPGKTAVMIDIDGQCCMGRLATDAGDFFSEDKGGGLYALLEELNKHTPDDAEVKRLLEAALHDVEGVANAKVMFASKDEISMLELKAATNNMTAQMAWASFIKLLKARFDYIFIDTPGTSLSQLTSIALGHTDLTILPVDYQSDYTMHEAVDTCDSIVNSQKVKATSLKIAFILNKVDGRTDPATIVRKAQTVRKVLRDALAAIDKEPNYLGALRNCALIKKTECQMPLVAMASMPSEGMDARSEIVNIACAVENSL